MINGRLKIATIGGGSSYTPELVEGFLKRLHELPVGELWLVDVEDGAHKQEIVTDLARRMAQKVNADIRIVPTLDRRAALENADFVTTQFRVGFLDAREKDERIPASHHVIGQETNGPGGMFKALRTIPVILDICRDMDELCPDAWLISFTNPSGINAEAVLRYAGKRKMIGLCNNGVNMHADIAAHLQLPESEVRVDFTGINHMVFAVHAWVHGEDRLPLVLREMEEEAEKEPCEEGITPYVPGFLQTLGALPCSYLRYYVKTDEMLHQQEKDVSEGRLRAQEVKRIEAALFEKYADPALDVKPPELAMRGGARYSDAACNLISSLYNDKGDIQVVNIPNTGRVVPSLEEDCVVEVSARITKNGPVALPVGDPPEAVTGLMRHLVSFQKLTEDAAVAGDYQKALMAMTMNPLVPGDRVAKLLLDELLEAHRKYLPQFAHTGR